MKTAWRADLHRYIEEHYTRKPNEWYSTTVDPRKHLDISIVSDRFEGMSRSQRAEELKHLVHRFSPSTFINLWSADTPGEACRLELERPSESLDLDRRSISDWLKLACYTANLIAPSKPRHEPRTPKSVVFYSFKGGVGRTTALAYASTILALRGHRVLALDLDVPSPGLGTALGAPSPAEPLINYFVQRFGFPEDMGLEHSITIEQVVSEVPLANTAGRLFVASIGDLTFDYLSSTDFLNVGRDFKNDTDLWDVFYREVTAYLQPDVILVDAHLGIEGWSAFVLLHAADQALLFLRPDEQHLQGTRLVIEALGGLLPTRAVFAKVPTSSEKAMERVRQQWAILQFVKAEATTEDGKLREDAAQAEEEPLIIPHLPELVLPDSFPLAEVLPHYMALADLIEREII